MLKRAEDSPGTEWKRGERRLKEVDMSSDPQATELESTWGTPGRDEPASPDHQLQEPEDPVPGGQWVPSGRRLLSGLLGLNVVLLGAALLAGQAFNSAGLPHDEPRVFMLLLMGISLLWMLWYLLWARKQPDTSPQKDHHAGGISVTLVLLLFAVVSLLLYAFLIGYLVNMRECKPVVKVLSPFIEAPFLTMQTYLLWAHSKDCIHRHKIITRTGLMLILSADLLLWLNAVTEDTIHAEIELEKEDGFSLGKTESLHADLSDAAGVANSTSCQCGTDGACLTFRKGVEVLYPFNMEFYLMAGCMIYVMWKNVGRRMSTDHHHVDQKLTLHAIRKAGITYGLVFGVLVLVAGATIFILYHVWVSRQQYRYTAFLLIYSFHLAVMPVMSLCCLAGMLVHRLERRAHEGGHNPTRALDVILLVAAALGQLGLSYFSLVAALAVGTQAPLAGLDVSYSLLSLLELILQNIFIIEGLHRHPSLIAKKKKKQRNNMFKPKKKTQEEKKTDASLVEGNPSAAGGEHDGKKSWAKRAIKEICTFLILSNIMLWVIPAFGVHPQFEIGLGKQYFGFSAWFVLVNLGQPLVVFYRMHSVGALMELLISA